MNVSIHFSIITDQSFRKTNQSFIIVKPKTIIFPNFFTYIFTMLIPINKKKYNQRTKKSESDKWVAFVSWSIFNEIIVSLSVSTKFVWSYASKNCFVSLYQWIQLSLLSSLYCKRIKDFEWLSCPILMNLSDFLGISNLHSMPTKFKQIWFWYFLWQLALYLCPSAYDDFPFRFCIVFRLFNLLCICNIYIHVCNRRELIDKPLKVVRFGNR
jgi:hypothetical protein